MIVAHYFFQISENDDLPTNVCRKCLDNVNNWHIFKTICERTQNRLQSFINKDSNLLEEVGLFNKICEHLDSQLSNIFHQLFFFLEFQVKIKNEPMSDEAYDDGVVIDGSYPDIEV